MGRKNAVCDDFPKDGGLVAHAAELVCQEFGDHISGGCVVRKPSLGGSMRPPSDLDLAVLPRQSLDPMRLWELAQKVAAKTCCEVDLVDPWRVSTVLQQQIVVNGSWVWVADRRACQRLRPVRSRGTATSTKRGE